MIDRTVKINTYLKSPYFSASNGEYLNSLRSFSIFWVYTQDYLYMKPQWSHSESGYIFENP